MTQPVRFIFIRACFPFSLPLKLFLVTSSPEPIAHFVTLQNDVATFILASTFGCCHFGRAWEKCWSSFKVFRKFNHYLPYRVIFEHNANQCNKPLYFLTDQGRLSKIVAGTGKIVFRFLLFGKTFAFPVIISLILNSCKITKLMTPFGTVQIVRHKEEARQYSIKV